MSVAIAVLNVVSAKFFGGKGPRIVTDFAI
jgi:hypothetical protein